jgi:putative ABC transport system ATP-binding protein
MIQLKNVYKSYKNNEVSVLSNINLTINKGSQIAILGPSGSGKSTLLRILAGLEKPNDGSVLYKDTPLYKLNDEERAKIRRDNFGFIFQSFRLFNGLNVLENVALSLDIKGDEKSISKAKKCLENVGLSHRLSHYPAELSGGEMQRVAIARALSTDPSIIFADEPTGNLDQKNSDMVKELLMDCLKSSDASLVLVTHDNNLAKMCPTIFTLSHSHLEQEQ